MNRKQVRDRRVSISKVHRTRGERSPTNREFAHREKCSVEPHLDVAAQFTEAGTRRDNDRKRSHSNATGTNLLTVGSTHLYRDRLGTDGRDHAGCGDFGARAGHCVSTTARIAPRWWWFRREISPWVHRRRRNYGLPSMAPDRDR